MGKQRKLTQNQKRRIQSNHHNKIHKKELEWQDEMLGETKDGLVIARHAKHADVENSDGEVCRCNLRRTLKSVVVGDKVSWRKGSEQLQGISGVIEAIYPRKNELSRPDYYDGIKVMASNIDQIIIVSAVLPELSLNIIDRYLVICENAKIPALIVLNKIDLLNDDERQEVEKQLDIYRNIGYQSLCLSAQTGEGMEKLDHYLSQGTSIFVGQSGVGKSSLINQILPESNILTNKVSTNSGLGQHTTTASYLYQLPQGGKLIDSPGIREFGLWHLEVEQITQGYIEFQSILGLCRFRDCKHNTDPNCAIREAVEEGKINRTRFENYHRLIESSKEVKGQRYFKNN
ncbi:small ribosomal subunit biogenesis GTPase RsgA [Pasteurella atlantica]|uniref:small ribosomal subunit biogenesis GTPase RsgA n=1 Tax=Pasteurellaceae TaxID=712 RepID=UPI00275B0075|nr:small ribosomal subunit biogenesis GTPase RsgA [Pasteurella atlantica]MDP8033430.1 small ribosomal subunit biogenesis GTPase RsgA [Pasteurella atlantica]MDP8035366.1 small ribosomal subunit biogenesis GTPase RsgA [Pasteurella atlantica]MDP8037316.1 small ribosomal subunit biogenesis GTPase RsgA [Pasteurella atlantica]MDP8047570.1 small ribosomal subunit biogenesis GTPase RsgA [Pasteurella atlantica]MDP8049619.1 small ribosomal subunit biogenesis GTPase RsgA [Pasteurella atlantica]